MERIGVIVSIILLAYCYSCKKDDSSESAIKFDNVSVPLADGVVENRHTLDTARQSYLYTIYLLGTGLTHSEDSSQWLSGTGSFMAFNVYGANAEEVEPGEYTFDRFASRAKFTVDTCRIYLNYNVAQDSGTVVDIRSGLFNIEKAGNVYHLKLNLYTDQNQEFNVDYNGYLETISAK
jgi:hypothetical protein